MIRKSININQRIPLDTLYVALESYLDDNYSEEYIFEQLRLEFKGENRLKKSVKIVNKVIPLNPNINFIKENRVQLIQAIKNKHDRNVILIALLNSRFTFAFDTLQYLGKFLSVQELVNKETVKKSLTNVYGGNRSTENAFNSVVPMFIEAGFITRPHPAVYKRNLDLRISSSISKQLYIESFKCHQIKKEILDYQLRDPYFFFLQSQNG